MARILVDTNILIDLLTEDKQWFEWSAKQITILSLKNELVINQIIYAELSVMFDDIHVLNRALKESYFIYAEIPWEAAFLAGKAFKKYRQQGGIKHSPLPDFFIGAHASISQMTLLTRDTARYKTYFPTLSLIAPK